MDDKCELCDNELKNSICSGCDRSPDDCICKPVLDPDLIDLETKGD